MQTFKEQEKAARSRLSPSAVLKAAMVAGLITFFVPGGPWMSYEAGFAAMGRAVSESWLVASLWQAAFSLAYGWAIAAVIYSLSLMMGIVVGALMSVPLYAVNTVVISAGMGVQSNEVHAGIAHFMFCLLFSAIYRAMAVPMPRELPRH